MLPEPISQSLEQTRKFTAIGLQPFSRPGEQKGFALKLDPGQDLNTLQGIKIHKFRHDYQAAEVIYNRMNQGKILFPRDRLNKMAKKLKKSKKISKAALKLACKRYPVQGKDEHNLEEQCLQKGISFVDWPVLSFSKNDEDVFWEKWNNGAKQRFISKLVYRPVC